MKKQPTKKQPAKKKDTSKKKLKVSPKNIQYNRQSQMWISGVPGSFGYMH
jgi:hypothetical protein